LDFALFILSFPQLSFSFFKVKVTIIITSEFLNAFHDQSLATVVGHRHNSSQMDYLNLDQKVSQVLPESGDILIQIEKSFNRNLQLKLG